MAQKTDIAAAKARKQKIILAAAGVALIGLAVIQVPKMMKKSDSQPVAAAPAAATAGTATGTTTAVVVSTNTGTFKPAGYVAGVALPGGSKVVVATNKLAAFTLFEAKDPFVQQEGDEASASPTSETTTTSAETAPTASGGTTATSDTGTTTAPPPIVYATITLDGKPQQVKVKEKFPKNEPLFVLVSLKKKLAKIGVAGGSFADGQTVTLTAGKKLTLVDTATGVRYELKLVYTGAEPEQIEAFSSATQPAAAAEQPAASSGGTTAAATP